MRPLSFVTCLTIAAGALTYAPEAYACGGCFVQPPPPGESPSIVTDHRMVMSVSPTQSTLYDQIRYQGSPDDFAWILPIAGTVDVGISADSLFNGLEAGTKLFIQQPPTGCPTLRPECTRGFGGATGAGSSGTSSASSSSGGVSVIKEEIVGPYATVQLKPASENDTAAVLDWLTTNGYTVPADVKPIIQQYVKEHFNFLALKLKPDESVSSMRPVRVTTQGANVALPLRMVAAGTGANVGITLWVVSGGRYQTTNFESFAIGDDVLSWDWTKGTSNYTDLRAEEQAKKPGRRWEVETSTSLSRDAIDAFASNAARAAGSFEIGGDYLDVKDGNVVTKPARQVRTEDLDTLVKGLSGSIRVTRLRADLARAALAEDLLVGAAPDQAELPTTRFPKKEIGQPLCNVIRDCEITSEQLPRDQAIAKSTGFVSGTTTSSASSSGATPTGGNESDGTFTCMSAPATKASSSVAMGFLALAFARLINRRRRP